MIVYEQTRCIGFGIYEGKCSNQINKARSEYWCNRCENLRRDHITKQLEKIARKINDR